MKAQAVSGGRRNEGQGQANNFSRYPENTWEFEVQVTHRAWGKWKWKSVMACHMVSLPPVPTPPTCQDKGGRTRVTSCAGFSNSNYRHRLQERGSADSSLPKCLFFSSSGGYSSYEHRIFFAPKLHLSRISISFGKWQFYVTSLCNSHLTFSSS